MRTPCWLKHLCSIRALIPVSFFLSLPLLLFISLFLADSLEHESQLCNPGNISLFPSFAFSLSTPDHQVPVRYRTNTPVFLPWESHGQRRLAGYSLWSHKELDRTELITLPQIFICQTISWREVLKKQTTNKKTLVCLHKFF